tara:strand:+ start:709 stop:834 length:126 start_codon:yes stop_codon:yes gene_type:complete
LNPQPQDFKRLKKNDLDGVVKNFKEDKFDFCGKAIASGGKI